MFYDAIRRGIAKASSILLFFDAFFVSPLKYSTTFCKEQVFLNYYYNCNIYLQIYIHTHTFGHKGVCVCIYIHTHMYI